MRRVSHIACVALYGCGGAGEPLRPPASEITAVSFNVHGSDGIHDAVIGPNMAAQVTAVAPDFVALQECVGCADFVALLPDGYELGSPSEGVSVAYDSARWRVVDDGDFALGGNDDGWGVRRAAWVRFSSLADEGTVDVYSTHWCVSIRNTDDKCDAELQVEYGDKMLAAIEDGNAAAILAGDLNVFDGFEDSLPIRSLIDHGLIDTLREITQADVVTFHGNTWAPPGRIDYVFTTSGTTTSDAFVDESLSSDDGSDHNPVVATFTFDAP